MFNQSLNPGGTSCIWGSQWTLAHCSLKWGFIEFSHSHTASWHRLWLSQYIIRIYQQWAPRAGYKRKIKGRQGTGKRKENAITDKNESRREDRGQQEQAKAKAPSNCFSQEPIKTQEIWQRVWAFLRTLFCSFLGFISLHEFRLSWAQPPKAWFCSLCLFTLLSLSQMAQGSQAQSGRESIGLLDVAFFLSLGNSLNLFIWK